MTGVDDLRVDHRRGRVVVGDGRPRFSWIAAHDQCAYRIRVRHDDEIVWDSGRIASSRTHLVDYAGPALISNTDYAWSVRSWSADGDAAASAIFETPLLDVADHHAAWVRPAQRPTAVERWSLLDWIRGAGPDTPPEERLRPVQLLRQSFDLPEQPARARLYATARGVYTAWVNGERAGDETLSPGFDAYEHRHSVQCFDVTTALRPGANVLELALADGWWAGRIGITGSSAQWGEHTSAWWQLHVDLVDGTECVVGSGPDVVSRPGPWRYADLFVGECFDAAAARQAVEVEDWTPVVDVDHDTTTLVPFAGEPVRPIAELPPASVDERDGAVIVDFGQVIAGRVRIRLHDTVPGQRVTIEHTELLGDDGSWFQNITGINTEQTDVYLAAGGRSEQWEPEFTFHGFRYARISGARVAPDDVRAVVIASDLEQTGGLHTSDDALNRLHENIVWSQRANFLAVPTDCPQRERAGWTGDIQVFAPAATNNAQVAPFLRRWLADVRADQAADGAIPIFSPRSPFDRAAAQAAEGIGAITTAAGWGDAITLVPWTLWERYGDRRVLEENYEAMTRWVGYQATAAYLDGAHFGDWLTPSTLEGRPYHEAIGVAPALTGRLCAEMFRIRSLDVVSHVAVVLGEDDAATSFARDAAALRVRFADANVDSDGALPVQLQGVYVLALAFDLVPAEVRDRTAARLASLVRERGDRLDTGFLSVGHLLDVLWDTGHADVARRVLWQRECPSWLYEVDQGATTVWESWDAVVPGRPPRPVSLNHYAFGCVDDVLFRRIAGIQPTSPGYATARLVPDLECGLARLDAHVGTPYGRLGVAWETAGGTAEVTVEVPHGIHATLQAGGADLPLSAGRSRHRLSIP